MEVVTVQNKIQAIRAPKNIFEAFGYGHGLNIQLWESKFKIANITAYLFVKICNSNQTDKYILMKQKHTTHKHVQHKNWVSPNNNKAAAAKTWRFIKRGMTQKLMDP